jgi:hypothetical protein
MITVPAYGGGLGVGAEQVLPAGKSNTSVSLSLSLFLSFVHAYGAPLFCYQQRQ